MEIPVLFKTPMVQRILVDRKNMTRRLRGLKYINEHPDNWEFLNTSDKLDFPRPADCKYPDRLWYKWTNIHNNGKSFITQCPYGKPGDILWVRENWCEPVLCDGFEKDYYYQADDIKVTDFASRFINFKWKPSIHMPRKACRILLQVEEIRVERLQDITEADAIAEGIHPDSGGWKSYEIIHEGKHKGEVNPHSIVPNRSPITSYKELWQSINGLDSWDKNPWLWVVKFKKL